MPEKKLYILTKMQEIKKPKVADIRNQNCTMPKSRNKNAWMQVGKNTKNALQDVKNGPPQYETSLQKRKQKHSHRIKTNAKQNPQNGGFYFFEKSTCIYPHNNILYITL